MREESDAFLFKPSRRFFLNRCFDKQAIFFAKIISEISQKFPPRKFSNKNECNHLPLYIPCLLFYFISNQRNNSFGTMLYKNFLKLSRRETTLRFNSGGARLLQTLHKPRLGKFPNDNSLGFHLRGGKDDDDAAVESHVRASGFSRKSS
ncbi:hypothetical protein PUN28_012388 [Cardiocondyla obscurior]|uniref:Uncharacterized protein n=1 Tax=Cardiocondyla obscurior TaxID=286306 RepID=A0AAW2FB75_9HYME